MARLFTGEFRLFLPLLPDEQCWREPVEHLLPARLVQGSDKQVAGICHTRCRRRCEDGRVRCGSQAAGNSGKRQDPVPPESDDHPRMRNTENRGMGLRKADTRVGDCSPHLPFLHRRRADRKVPGNRRVAAVVVALP